MLVECVVCIRTKASTRGSKAMATADTAARVMRRTNRKEMYLKKKNRNSSIPEAMRGYERAVCASMLTCSSREAEPPDFDVSLSIRTLRLDATPTVITAVPTHARVAG